MNQSANTKPASKSSSLKEFFRKRTPGMFVALRKFKDQLVIETRTMRMLGLRGLFRTFVRSESWQDKLPVQKPTICQIPDAELKDWTQLAGSPSQVAEGAHSIYLDPQVWSDSVFSELQQGYPENCGLKVFKRPGNVDDLYLNPDASGKTQAKALSSHRNHLVTMNFLHLAGISPKVFDVIELHGKDVKRVAYVVQHVAGGAPSDDICRAKTQDIKAMVSDGVLTMVNWNSWDDNDFACPDCNGNLIADESAGALYVDTQNFAVAGYDKTLTGIARQAQSASHFGDRSHLLGGSYLYQAVPGVSLPAKRDPARRIVAILDLLDNAGITLEGRPVLDIGCNLGLMGAQYLAHGARWIHGWDLPKVVEQTRRVLLGIGCTRFSLTGTVLDEATDLADGLPEFLLGILDQTIVSYLAIRGHVGWLPSLSRIKWQYMIYEGHEEESVARHHDYFEELSAFTPCKVIAESNIEDGTSLPRYIAILEREPLPHDTQ